MNRREFVKQTALGAVVAGFPAVIPSSARGAAGKTAPNDKINVGCIGTGPQGRGVMWNFLAQNDARVTAVCDVKDDQLKIARDTVNGHYKNSDCATYRDFKEVLARKDIDVVLIATPDHWHVPIAVAAAEAGKDMYVEKPMGLTVAEDKILREAIKKHKRVFQFGTQQRSGENFWRACELVRNGYIGELKHVNVWSPASHPGGATDPLPVPPGIDYDRWLGPAPYTPYTKNKCSDSNKTWWFNYDYALGFIAGWGVHPLDIALWGTDAFMAGPLEAEGRAVIPTIGACNTAIAWWVNFKCSNGVTADFFGTPNGYSVISKMNNLASFEKKYRTVLTHGTAFEGADGWILVDRSGLRSYPEDLANTRIKEGESKLMRSYNHARNLLDGVKSRNNTVCNIDAAVQADEMCHISDITTRLNRKVVWNPKTERFVNDEQANSLLSLRKMRYPWQL